ncbi:MAG TPA: hypothetical protein VGX28_15040 [Frankiaceae bacterium]|nr:hypothetical protein [Frankiaceae bacterium]
MRRILVVAAVAAAFAGSVPAANAYLVSGCQSGDWSAANVVVAGVEVVQVCMDHNPLRDVVTVCLPCIVK